MSNFKVKIFVYDKMNSCSKETIVIDSDKLKEMAIKQFAENTNCPENHAAVCDVELSFE